METTPTAIDIAKLASAHYGIPAAEILTIMKTPTSPATLRDEFAGRAMQGLLAAGGAVSIEPHLFANEAGIAYAAADALLKARTKPAA